MRMLESAGMRFLGHHDLGGYGTCGEGTALLEREGRRYLYIANERGPVNFSIVDVTDPRAPHLCAQTRLPHADMRSNSLALGDGLLIVAYQVARPGLQPAGIEVFDLTDPVTPRPTGFCDLSGDGSRGTHWVGYTGGRYAFAATGTPDSRPRDPRDDQFTVIIDVSRPDKPVEAGRWWLPGTMSGDDAPPPPRHPVWDSGFRAHNINQHRSRDDRAYVGYIDGGMIILDISDVSRPQMITRLDYHPPMPGFTHTVLPLLDRGLVAISDESVADGAADYPKLIWFADVSYESNPVVVSTAPMPPVSSYSGRGGRFGAHNLHENEPFPWSWQSSEVVFGTFFNGGVRAFSLSDPFRPREVAALVPDGPIQINDVYVSADGIVYAVDRAGAGLFIAEFTG
jgi:hypothetical protein